MEYNFLPYWYKQNKKRRRNLVSLGVILGVVAINICLICEFLHICRNIENLKGYNSNINLKYQETPQRKINNKDTVVYKNFETFLGLHSNYENVCNIKADDKSINVKFKIKDMVDYENLVKEIESFSKYKILNLEAPENDSAGNKFFNVDIQEVQ
ncbi:hypothetical protein [Clostridium akagii]|uniref:hypothetical protein n=1 Tax=Clostridium akagii TaxID=91623 RepID=UPI00047C57A0|nr:hypothetical protein [Clostridium akagii]